MFIERYRCGLLTLLFALSLLFGLGAPAALAKSSEMPLTANKAALAIFVQARAKAENLENAGTMFDQAVQLDPNFAFGYLFAGQTNVEFRKNLEKAVSLAPTASPAEREWILSAAAQNIGDQAATLKHLQNLEKLYPRDKRVLMQVGNYYRGIGDDAGGLKYFLAASAVDKKYAPPYNIIGYSHVALGNFAEADKAFKMYISLIPNNANPYDSYAEMLLNSGKFDESIKQYTMALSKDPTFYNSYAGMGNAYEYKGDFTKARETYRTMFDKSTNEGIRAQALTSLTNSWVAEGNIDEALKVNHQRIEIAQKAGDIQTVLGLHQLAAFITTESGDFNAAAKHLEMAADLMNDPSLSSATSSNRAFIASAARTRLMIAKGDTGGAKGQIDWMAGAAKNLNQQRVYNFLAGFAELKQRHYAEATGFFARSNQADPLTWYYQAQALEGAGDAAGARKIYQKIVSLNQLDTVGYAFVRPRAVTKLKE
ncbi:MAG TPA: tetratricopeptide repeat protein [Pyrinomonadaceae bacterium]|nr:tetratricopeptide repeat protein [Pyrinomonadaceae bacterium]